MAISVPQTAASDRIITERKAPALRDVPHDSRGIFIAALVYISRLIFNADNLVNARKRTMGL